MQKKILFFLFILSTFYSFSQNDKKDILKDFDKTGMETSILYQKSPLVNIQKYSENPISMYGFYQVYKDLFQYDFEKRYASLNTLKEKTKQSYFDNIIPLAIIHCEYETITDEAFKNGRVTNDSHGLLKRTDTSLEIFEQNNLTLASPLRIKKKGLETKFILTVDNIFNSTNNEITAIKIDFDDTLGFRNITIDKEVIIQYQSAGTKELIFKIIFSDGTITTSKSKIKILYSNTDNKTLFNRVVEPFTSEIPTDLLLPYGETVTYAGEGEFEIFESTENGAVFDKPIIIVDGFDPGDTRPIVGYTDSGTGDYVSGIYDLLDFNNNGTPSNLADLVRAEGFDVVILNFPEYTRSEDNALVDGGSDFVERNAMLLVKLIDSVNILKVGTEKNVIIGPSMGGLISRYALSHMENPSLSLDHDTRLWLSFDSPHHGANVPIGFQHQFNFLAFGLDDFTFIGNQNIVELQPIVDGMLKSAAARQMLTDQFEAHLNPNAEYPDVDFDPSKSLPQKHPFNTIFYNRLNDLTTSGFPENLRKIAIINGSGVNNRYQNINGVDLVPGSQILNTSFNVTTGTDITLSVNFSPPTNTEINVSHVYLDFAWYIPAFDVESNADSKAHPYSNGIDAASGGLFNIGALTATFGTTGTVGNYLTALQTDYFNFIPSVSAMALEITNDEINWFHTPSNLVTAKSGVNNTTPFDAWHMPIDNEPHVTVTQDNFVFAWDEIVLSVLNTNEFDLENTYTLIKNPVSDIIQVQINKQNIKNVTAKVYAITGQEIVSKTFNNPANQIEIPVNLSSGVYILKLNDNETIFKTKIIVQ
ncbi:MAG: hypothetical protein COA67_12500 [Lutibacter sp.]|nr:MAG: hypothetical protein COA67_12500 [Lutibacter sp.]